jgi:hypothetical protein
LVVALLSGVRCDGSVHDFAGVFFHPMIEKVGNENFFRKILAFVHIGASQSDPTLLPLFNIAL